MPGIELFFIGVLVVVGTGICYLCEKELNDLYS